MPNFSAEQYTYFHAKALFDATRLDPAMDKTEFELRFNQLVQAENNLLQWAKNASLALAETEIERLAVIGVFFGAFFSDPTFTAKHRATAIDYAARLIIE